jgi:hypothetical protein
MAFSPLAYCNRAQRECTLVMKLEENRIVHTSHLQTRKEAIFGDSDQYSTQRLNGGKEQCGDQQGHSGAR